MQVREAARAAFLTDAGWADAEARWRPGDASFRRYARLTRAGGRAMLMDAPPPKESVGPFLDVGEMLRRAGISAPAILAANRADGFLLLEDLGDATFTTLLDGGADPQPLYDLAVDALIHIRRHIDPVEARALPSYDAASRTAHLSTVTDWLWPELFGRPMPPAERALFQSLWQRALKAAPTLGRGFVHRDFHVDNLMRLDGRPGVAACGVLDFQDAGFGPYAYDLASLVEDARRDLDPALKARCLKRYRAAFPAISEMDMQAALAVHGGQRHLRVAGLWVRLWRRDGKGRYLGHMRRTWRHFEQSLEHPLLADVRAFLENALPQEARARMLALAEAAGE